jgi:phenylacetate 2-hydroxylase
LKSINVSLVSGGFETLATTSLAGLGYLASEEGLEMQEKAYKAIMDVYKTPEDAWEKAISEETVPYVVALVREMLRHYAALPILPPRQTMSSFNWRGTMVPKGLSVYMNAQAINHDPLAYGADAHVFRPERWLGENVEMSPQPPYHFSLGAGSRACTAIALTNRVMYATMVRLIISFKIVASKTSPPVTDYIDYNEDRSGQTAICKRYKIVLEERQERGTLSGNLERSQAKTKGLAI